MDIEIGRNLYFIREIFLGISETALLFWEAIKKLFDFIASDLSLSGSIVIGLLLLGVGTGLVIWAFNFIRGLLGKIGNR